MIYYTGYKAPSPYELIFPNHQLQWVIPLDETPRRYLEGTIPVDLPASWIQGPFQTGVTFEAERDATTLSILLQPGSVRRFIQFSAAELTGLMLDAREIFSEAQVLQEALRHTKQPALIFSAVEQYLNRKLIDAKSAALSRVAALRLATGNISVKALADEFGYSNKQLIHIFKQNTGLTPKVFARICRLHRLAENVAAGQPLLDAGLAGGFYDQAHINNEFKAMLDLTPGQYLAARTEYPHVVAR